MNEIGSVNSSYKFGPGDIVQVVFSDGRIAILHIIEVIPQTRNGEPMYYTIDYRNAKFAEYVYTYWVDTYGTKLTSLWVKRRYVPGR